MSKSADLVVVGGGIAGLTTALAATERGLSVVVIDEPRLGAASRAALVVALARLAPPAGLRLRARFAEWQAMGWDREPRVEDRG
jgi:glycine/D-amino acid oxidase-like deaminating enzyme